MVIKFNEQRFISEIKKMVQPLGLSKSQVEEVVSHVLEAVRRASTPVRD